MRHRELHGMLRGCREEYKYFDVECGQDASGVVVDGIVDLTVEREIKLGMVRGKSCL